MGTFDVSATSFTLETYTVFLHFRNYCFVWFYLCDSMVPFRRSSVITSTWFKTECGVVNGNLDARWYKLHIITLNCSCFMQQFVIVNIFIFYVKSTYCNHLCYVEKRVCIWLTLSFKWISKLLIYCNQLSDQTITHILIPNLAIYHYF